MPNPMMTSFASAAAGASSDSMARREGGGSDWSTRNRPNGTQTFRRPSTQSRDNLNAAANTSSSTERYIPPHLNPYNARNGIPTDTRYTKEQLLDVWRSIPTHVFEEAAIKSFRGDFDPRAAESRDAGVEACWIPNPVSEPLGLQPLDENERELFSDSVNSSIKMNNQKDGTSLAPGGRKTSLSVVNTSGVPRPGARRRETGESFAGNGPLSPTENKTFRNDPITNTPPPALLRRRTDYMDDSQERDEPKPAPEHSSPLGLPRRSGTGGPLSAASNPASASPWSAGGQSAFGAMGAFSTLSNDLTIGHDPPAQRPAFGSARSTSRFKDIMSKGSEDMSPSVKEKASFNGLEKLPEEDDLYQSRLREDVKTRPNRSETNPYDDLMPGRTGSAALSAHDESAVVEQLGFNPYPSRDQQSAQTPHHRFIYDPTSPTSTNPYQSPHGGHVPDDEQEPSSRLPPIGRRDVFSGAEHRGHNSLGSLRGGGLGGMSGLGGWTNPGFGMGTPARERPPVSTAFGDPVFGPLGVDLKSPGAFGGNSFFGGGFGTTSRNSNLGLPFPPAMQEQMRSDSRNDAFGVRTADPFEPPRQDSIRGAFDRAGDEAFGQLVNRSPPGLPTRSGSGELAERSGSGSPNSLSIAQQRQMVMPDRMRWVYRDPLGNMQGPFNGLEMHDWFKAGFFNAELQVKKLEDIDYEPLAQLVRRIGNSREPFLVPQIGVPHGQPAAVQGASNPWAVATPSSAQPPFASAFPSFGTTLTAEQQNALERRKQEEQFLMARQKEFLAQRQVNMHGSNGPHGNHMHGLQHHSSAHSLHSQPSFGSITSPTGYNPSPLPVPIGQAPQHANNFQSMTPTSSLPPGSRDEDLSSQFGRMGFDNRGPYTNVPNQPSFAAHERNRMSMETHQAQQYAHEQTFLGDQGRNERLDEFHEFRQDMAEDELEEEALPAPIGSQRPTEEVAILKQQPAPIGAPTRKPLDQSEPLSLTQQVQRAAAANKQAAEEKPVVQIPPVSISPLPAPAAQRSRPTTVAEQLVAGSRSATQTPAETPGVSLAPWAEKTAELTKGPSLKQIQETEAKRAAEQEALVAEARRVQTEQERIALQQVIPPAPGLPMSSIWASSASPATSTTPSGSAWTAKPVAAKAISSTTTKKTLAQIQKEEEARKQRSAAQAATAAQGTAYTNAALSSGNRYAQMASKTIPQQSGSTPAHAHIQPAGNSAWTTVGASGKPKTPATVVAAPSVQRSVSNTTAASRPILNTARSASVAANSTKNHAKEELTKWAKSQLGSGLKTAVNVDDFVSVLFSLGQDVEILADAIYGSSDILDGRRFAEEFVRRRKLADKGVVEAGQPAPPKTSSNGWNEVAKKPVAAATTPREDPTADFKIVSKNKKKR